MELRSKYLVIMNAKKISRLKREYCLKTVIRRKSAYRKNHLDGSEHLIAKNLLNRRFNPAQPDQVYSTDVSYLEYRKGYAYLSATKDLATKEIVAYSVMGDLKMHGVLEGISPRLSRLSKSVRMGLMIHSDQGAHYTNKGYANVLKSYGVTQSMSRKGTCLDNAPIESFFGHMKDEVEIKSCATLEEVRKVISKYIRYYNYKRNQWGLKKMTPVAYRRHLLKAS